MHTRPDAADVFNAVVACIEGDKADMLSVLLANGVDANLRIPGHDWTLLHLAAEHQSAATLALLLERDADVKMVDASGCTPLHHAVDIEADAAHQADGTPEPILTHLLLRAGADPRAKDAEGKTPIDIAREYDYAAALTAMESVSA
ncbi:ankyrin repeat domain-containing protein [Pseudenhygromyxa sp. WMMC2535]|nr:ankyrin repeat domain-containing protein [Pseudenhygromyxa sp. WMMC2535]NVB36409.1 ankyrin repeat domain-containing protein [Pseudenhygromyxa sp. WMMC2535]